MFEGGEGAGKTTQIDALAEDLTQRGLPVLVTREPGGTPTAEAIRELLLTPTQAPMSDRCEVLLFAAARADHVAKVIDPALARGEIVLCDRYIDSSLAYQGFARGVPVSEVASISSWATDHLQADLTVLLDIDPSVGVARARDGNRMEDEGLQFHRRVRQGLLSLAEADPARYVVIDAAVDAPQVTAQVRAAVERTMAERT